MERRYTVINNKQTVLQDNGKKKRFIRLTAQAGGHGVGTRGGGVLASATLCARGGRSLVRSCGALCAYSCARVSTVAHTSSCAGTACVRGRVGGAGRAR